MTVRRGHSLVECLVAMTLFGAAFSVIGVTMHGLSLSERHVRQGLDADREYDRLAVQLRQDAHQAVSAVIEDATEPAVPASVLALRWDDGQSVRYALRADHVERTQLQEQQIRHRETYRLPALTTSRWQLQTDRPRPLISLVCDSSPASAAGGVEAGTRRIDAAVQLFQPRPAVAKP